MVLDPKHFDDMDDYCDFDEKLEPGSDGDLSDGGPNQALSWRRIIIERAANNVKKAFELKTDLRAPHKKGALVFDEQANKFGRVVESRPGFLSMLLLGGGNLVRQDITPLDFMRKNRDKLTLPEMADAMGITEVEVLILLNQLELDTDKPAAAPLSPKATQAREEKSTKSTLKAKSVKTKVVKKKPEIKAALLETKLPKPSVKIAAKKKTSSAKKVPKSKEISFTKLLPKGATTDPIMDPNGYIQQNFLLMSNRELATATGLSEHTIRRKLGEWNLKRKDFVNKA